MIIGSHKELIEKGFKTGDIVWACNYKQTSNKERKLLKQPPVFGQLTLGKDKESDEYNRKNYYSYKPIYFVPFKKNSKNELAWSKAVHIESRYYATNLIDCINIYNQLLDNVINWHLSEIASINKDKVALEPGKEKLK